MVFHFAFNFRKRSSTLLQDTQPLHNFQTKLETSSNLRQDYAKIANILAVLKETKWEQILPDINVEQTAIKHESPFEKAKHLKSVATSLEVSPSSNLTNTGCEPDEKMVTSHSIRKRRNTADFTPSAKVQECCQWFDLHRKCRIFSVKPKRHKGQIMYQFQYRWYRSRMFRKQI